MMRAGRRGGAWAKGLVALCAAAAQLRAGYAAAGEEVFTIDPALTSAEFSVAHFWLTTLRGRFDRTQGRIVLDSNARAGRIDFSIAADSVDTGWSVRDGFIRGEHMFDASRFPLVRFRSTDLAFERGALVGASGELTMRNVTRAIAVRIQRMDCAIDRLGVERCGVAVVSSIKRSDFGMTFGLPFVGDDIDLSFQLSAHRVSP